MQDLLRKLPDVVRHGGGEEQRLPLCRQPFQDFPDVRQKAHVEHAVRLVNDEDFDPGQVDFTLFREIEQASRAGYGDFGPLAEFLDLGILVHPAVNGDALEFRRPSQPVDGLVDLFRQLPCRGDNQGAEPFARAAQQALQDGKRKRGGLSRSGLGHPHDVFALENGGNGLKLNRRRRRVTQGLDARFDLRV